LPSQKNQLAKRVEAKPSKLDTKNSIPKTTGKIKEDVIFAKDKSPDDLEIFD